MGREFLTIFSDWATSYDATVSGNDPEYKEVFANYEALLTKIVDISGESILEFGSGTGNLTEKFLLSGKRVYPIEPSTEMIAIAQNKENLKNQLFIEGDLEVFSLPNEPIDTIASSFVFHHLTETEKEKVIRMYADILPVNGKVIIGDTMFLSSKSFEVILNDAYETGKLGLAEDLEREYYPLMSDLENYFRTAGFTTQFVQMNKFAWILEATKL